MTLQEINVLRTASLGLPLGWEAVYIEENGQKVMRYLNGSVLQELRPATANAVHWSDAQVHPMTYVAPPVVFNRSAEILQGLERRLAK